MKNLRLLLVSLFIFSCVTHGQDSIRITNGEWEPFMSEYSAHYGVNSHVVSEAFKLEGIVVEWGFYPWVRAYAVTKSGTWDASASWWPAEETKQSFLLSDAISQTSFVFFHLKSYDFNWEKLNDLKNLRIGGTFEYDYGEAFMAASKNGHLKMDYTATDEQNYKKLLRGRIEIFPNDPVVGYAQIRNSLPIEEAKLITHHPTEFELSTLHLIISKKSNRAQYFLDKFNSGFKKLKISGRYDEMQNDLSSGKYDKKKTKWQMQD